jgi:membrane fusion protein, multidrug efflux system
MDERVDRGDIRPEKPRTTTPAPVAPARSGRSLWIGLILLILVAGGGYAAYRHFSSQPQASGSPSGRGRGAGRTQQGPPQPVGAATIDTGDIHVVLSQLGTVTPLATVTVKTQINGQLSQVAFTEGQLVKQGDFLAQIDPRPFQVTLEQAEATLAHDQALLADARLDLARYNKLVAQDSVASQTRDTQAALVHQDEATVKLDQASIDSSKLNLIYCHIISPVNGRVGLRQVDQGNYVQTSDTNGLVIITQLQPISVIFTMPEDALPAVVKAMHGTAKLQVTAFDRANTTQLAVGELETLDNQVDVTTGTVKARAIFQNTDDELFPNQFVNANLLVTTLQNVVRIPTAGIQRGAPGTYAYVINANNTVSIRPIKLGQADGGMTEVTSGLKAGERVVVDGADRLRDGQTVTIPPPPSATPAAATTDTPPAAQPGRHRRQQPQQQQ